MSCIVNLQRAHSLIVTAARRTMYAFWTMRNTIGLARQEPKRTKQRVSFHQCICWMESIDRNSMATSFFSNNEYCILYYNSRGIVLACIVDWFLSFSHNGTKDRKKEVHRTPAPWPEETAPKHDPKRDQWIPTHQQSSSRTIILSVAAAPSIAHVPIGPRARCPFAIESRQNRIRNREIPVPYLHGCGFQRPSCVRFEQDGGWQLTKVTQQI